jgi:hypothetical protein
MNNMLYFYNTLFVLSSVGAYPLAETLNSECPNRESNPRSLINVPILTNVEIQKHTYLQSTKHISIYSTRFTEYDCGAICMIVVCMY